MKTIKCTVLTNENEIRDEIVELVETLKETIRIDDVISAAEFALNAIERLAEQTELNSVEQKAKDELELGLCFAKHLKTKLPIINAKIREES